MENSGCPISSSIGKKLTIAVTGLGLYLFVLIHLAGNLQVFGGPEMTNAYAYKLKSMPLVLWGARFGLLAIFSLHIFTGIRLALQNRAARPQAYAKSNTVQATLASRTMVQTGGMILLFVIFHLAHFTLFAIHPEYANLHDVKGRHDVYRMMIFGFSRRNCHVNNGSYYIFRNKIAHAKSRKS